MVSSLIGEEEGRVGLAAVRDIRPQLRLDTPDEVGAFEQDLLAEFVLARASAESPTPRSRLTWRR